MPLVFVSHAAADKQIAAEFQKDIKADFLGMCIVFVSSSLDSLNAGFEWNQIIKKNLLKCSILVGLLSPVALTRGWVYAEFAAGWIRGIPTIPVCHSGLDRGALPAPISAFQALNLKEEDHLSHLYGLIADAVGCQKPNVDFALRTNGYAALTESIRIQREIVSWVRQLFEWNPALEAKLKAGQEDEDVLVPANLDQPFLNFAKGATDRGFLSIVGHGMAMGTRIGAQASIFKIGPGPAFVEMMAHLDSA
jgi:hypothetical protein